MAAQLDPADLAQYAIRGGDADFEEALGGAPCLTVATTAACWSFLGVQLGKYACAGQGKCIAAHVVWRNL